MRKAVRGQNCPTAAVELAHTAGTGGKVIAGPGSKIRFAVRAPEAGAASPLPVQLAGGTARKFEYLDVGGRPDRRLEGWDFRNARLRVRLFLGTLDGWGQPTPTGLIKPRISPAYKSNLIDGFFPSAALGGTRSAAGGEVFLVGKNGRENRTGGSGRLQLGR